MRRLSWKPRRSGAIYCAPACGGGCTKAAYDKAWRKARALARALGRGWKPVVSENLGWHYRACKGTLKVGKSFGSGYIAFLGEGDESMGGYWTGDGPTPRAAAWTAIREARRFVQHKADLLLKAEEAMKP